MLVWCFVDVAMGDNIRGDVSGSLERGSHRERDDRDELRPRSERTIAGGSHDGSKDIGPDADSPAVGTEVAATVASIKGSLGLFVETPGPRGIQLSGLIHLSEVWLLARAACTFGRAWIAACVVASGVLPALPLLVSLCVTCVALTPVLSNKMFCIRVVMHRQPSAISANHIRRSSRYIRDSLQISAELAELQRQIRTSGRQDRAAFEEVDKILHDKFKIGGQIRARVVKYKRDRGVTVVDMTLLDVKQDTSGHADAGKHDPPSTQTDKTHVSDPAANGNAANGAAADDNDLHARLYDIGGAKAEDTPTKGRDIGQRGTGAADLTPSGPTTASRPVSARGTGKLEGVPGTLHFVLPNFSAHFLSLFLLDAP